MYYRSNNTVINQPIFWSFNGDDLKETITYVMNGLFGKIENSFFGKQGINENVVGYNKKKYDELEKVYSMAYNNINSLTKQYIVANATLDDISKLEYNWNDNGAQAFSVKLIERCRQIVSQLVAEPFVCPTACGSIQFEYEKENGEYIEFEIYEDRIEVYSESLINGEEEFVLYGITANDKMKQMVVDFYG